MATQAHCRRGQRRDNEARYRGIYMVVSKKQLII